LMRSTATDVKPPGVRHQMAQRFRLQIGASRATANGLSGVFVSRWRPGHCRVSEPRPRIVDHAPDCAETHP
jgi:hypothetical protein